MSTHNTTETRDAAWSSETRFSLAVPAMLIAYAVLLGAVAYSLHAFMGWAAALPVAAVMTFVFGQLVAITVQRGLRSAVGVAALIGTLAVGTVTTSLAYATYYAKTSASESARRDLLLKQERAEREVQRVVTLASSAQLAIDEWARDALEKSQMEVADGGTCPGRESAFKAGPISNWRRDDARVAGTLARELKTYVDGARQAALAVAQLPQPADFTAIKANYAALNTAIDRAASLSKGGFVGGAITTLADRRSSQIDHPRGSMSCGDSGRLSLIERASVELDKLSDTQPMARLAPAIDLDQPMDVVTRGLVRGANMSAYFLSFGHLGNFSDDPLLAEAIKVSGWINRETVPFLLSLLAEAGVLLTSFIAAQAGRAPFRLALPDWVRHEEAVLPEPGTPQRWARRAAKLLSNLFWTEGHRTPTRVHGYTTGVHAGALTVQGHAAPESSNFAPIDLVPDPTLRQRERDFALRLAEWHHPWGMEDFVVLPFQPATKDERHMARALASHGLMRCVNSSAGWKMLEQRAPLTQALRDKLGSDCEQPLYEIWHVEPSYGHLLRLAAIDQHSAAMPATIDASDSASAEGGAAAVRFTSPHVPLRIKRLRRLHPFGAAT